MPVQPGTSFGPYRILKFIAKGGMGEVYLGEDERLNRKVAIKVLPEHAVPDSDAYRRFHQEAKTLAALSHPNVVTIFDVGIADDIPFVVMELLQGETLRERIDRSSLALLPILEIARSIAEGLRSAHAAGVIHRDLKPQNIFITSPGLVKILDFGLARWQKPDVSLSQMQTSSGVVAGTIPYMSPEQLRGQPVDARSDIFSFGCVIFEMLTGKSPFHRAASADTISAILSDQPSIPRNIPSEFSNFILHCLEKDPGQRFQTMQDLILVLQTITPVTAEPVEKTRVRRSIHSIAILPFENTGADLQMEYLSEGITEALINNLSQLPRLRVMARGTVFHYRGKQTDPVEAGRQLNVGAVLTGRVVQHGDKLLIATELMDVKNGWHLWGEQYSRDLTDLFSLQSDIAAEITNKLRLKLSPKEKRLLAKHYTDNTEAYKAYLKGRYYWNRRTRENFQKAIEHFTKAIEIDPLYALAYTGLADCFALLADFGILLLPNEAFAKSKAAAMRALEIDPSLAEAHTSLAHLKMHEFQWNDSEAEFKTSLQLNPGYETAHHWYFMCLTLTGRHAEAAVEMKKAEELDPLSLIIQTDIAACYYFQQEFTQAEKHLKKVLETDSKFASARRYLSAVYEQLGRYREAIEEYERARIDAGKEPGETREHSEELRAALNQDGAAGYWVKRLDYSEAQRKRGYVSPYSIAQLYASLSDKERAFELLEEACKEPSASMIYLKVDPRFSQLRSDARFIELLRRLNLSA